MRDQSLGRRWVRLLTIAVLVTMLAAPAPTTTTHAVEAPSVGGVQLRVTSAAGWPVYYDPDVPESAVQNVVSAIELAVNEIPRVTGLPAPSRTVTTYVLANRDRFRLAIAENRGATVDEVSEKGNGLSMWSGGNMRMFLKLPEVQSPASATGFVVHELVHLTVAQTANFRPTTQWMNEGYAEIVRYKVVGAVFPDAAEMIQRLHQLGLASGLHRNGGPLPWPDLVTPARFIGRTRLGYGQMAYGQSALMVKLLQERYGDDAVPSVFRAIGRGASPTAAFGEVFGPFAPLGEAFDAAITDIPAQFPPGLYKLAARSRADGVPVLVVLAGMPGDVATVEVRAGGVLVERQELKLDPVGFTRLAFGAAVTPGRIDVRVTTPSLGTLETSLEIEPAAQFPQRSAPVQIPRTGGVLPPPVRHVSHQSAA